MSAEPPAVRATLATAHQALGRGDLGFAEALAWQALELAPESAGAWAILGTVAAMLDLPGPARAWLGRARALAPDWDVPARNLALVEQRLARDPARARAPRPPDGAPARHLLVKAWGQGFWSDVDHVVAMLLLAEITGREPTVWWGANSLYNRGRTANAFPDFFAPIGAADLAALPYGPGATWPPKWIGRSLADEDVAKWEGAGSRLPAAALLARDEPLLVSDFWSGLATLRHWIPDDHALAGLDPLALYRTLLGRWLRPQPSIAAEAERYHAAELAGAPSVAVHARGTDKAIEGGDVWGALQRTFALLANADPASRLFLMCDDPAMIEAFRARFGDRLRVPPAQRGSGPANAHMDPAHDPLRLGVEVLRDVLVALRCDRFVGVGHSNVSNYVTFLRDWAREDCVLIGGCYLMLVHPLVYDRRAPAAG